jgi:hypothetical protein
MTPDVNVLLAASRKDHAHHAVAMRWLRDALEASKLKSDLTLLTTVIASFLRLATHPRIFATPTPIQHAVAFIDALIASPGVTLLAPQNEWPRLRALCLDQNLEANDIPDAWIAACVLQQKEILATFDKDFVRLLPANQLFLLQPATA